MKRPALLRRILPSKQATASKPIRTPSFLSLLDNQDWDAILFHLTYHREPLRWLSEATDFVGQTALHFTLKSRPPLKVLIAFYEIEGIEWSDCSMGWTPLHVAVGYGASPDVVAFLLMMHVVTGGQEAGTRGAAETKSKWAYQLNADGRTALHLVLMKMEVAQAECLKNIKRRHKEKSNWSLHTNSTASTDLAAAAVIPDDEPPHNVVGVVRLLLDACPQAAKAKDDHGKLPKDYLKNVHCAAELRKLLNDAERDGEISRADKQIVEKGKQAVARSCSTMGHQRDRCRRVGITINLPEQMSNCSEQLSDLTTPTTQRKERVRSKGRASE